MTVKTTQLFVLFQTLYFPQIVNKVGIWKICFSLVVPPGFLLEKFKAIIQFKKCYKNKETRKVLSFEKVKIMLIKSSISTTLEQIKNKKWEF